MSTAFDEIVKKEKTRIRGVALDRALHDLRAEGVSCERDGNGIVGKYRGEPFCVYVNWVVSSRNEVAGIVTTRYKGQDVSMKPPFSVLTS